jgi:hypothetical protein
MSNRTIFTGLVAVVVSGAILLAGTPPVTSGIPGTIITLVGDGGCYVTCPGGDGDGLAEIGAVITVTVMDITGAPIVGIPAYDYWLIGCEDNMVLCAGSNAINADSASNSAGVTTISGSLVAGGCDNSLVVVVQGIIADDPPGSGAWLCLPYDTKSPDITGDGGVVDLVVDLVDLATFAAGYTSPPQAYDACFDFNCDGVVGIVDF